MLFNKAAVQPSAEAGESADKKRANVKKILAYSATIICWIRGFCHGFFLFYKDYIFVSAAKILLGQLSVIFVHILLRQYWIRP